MSKMLNRIKNLFNKEDEFTKEQSLNAINTWLAQDRNKAKVKPNSKFEAKRVAKENPAETKRVETIADFIKNAKTDFTDEEFKDRKEEVIAMLQKMKKKNRE